MEFRILGPLEVWEAGQAVTLSGAKVGRAAVTQQPYFDWLHHCDRESGGGLYGLKTVGQQLALFGAAELSALDANLPRRR